MQILLDQVITQAENGRLTPMGKCTLPPSELSAQNRDCLYRGDADGKGLFVREGEQTGMPVSRGGYAAL